MTSNNFMAQLGATLVDHGFAILPIQPGTKKPGMYRGQAWHDYPKWRRPGAGGQRAAAGRARVRAADG